MTLLGIATQGARGSLAIGRFQGSSLHDMHQIGWDKKAMHSELATVKLQELLAQASVSLAEISQVAVVVGPGSFTGIRVGVNLARTLAYGLGAQVATFNTLEVLAFKNLAPGEKGLLAIKALREFHYNAAYERSTKGLLELLPIEASSETHCMARQKPGYKFLIEDKSPGFSTDIEASDLLKYLDLWPTSKSFMIWENVKPLYIRGSEAEEKLKLGLLKPV